MKYKLGLLAEYIILIFYSFGLYKILKHRYKTYAGEIDLIFLKKRQIVFVEVKARKGRITEEIVSYNQRLRIHRTAELYLARNPIYSGYDIRFDLAIVKPYSMPIIIKNAW